MKYGGPIMFACGIIAGLVAISLQFHLGEITGITSLWKYWPWAFIEEVVKILPILLLARYIQRSNIITYALWVAIGFAMFENFLFALGTDFDINTIAWRLLLATPLHAFATFTVAAFWREDQNWKGLLIGLALATILHAGFNIVLRISAI